MAPGETTFLGAIYAFGATLSFTVAHVSVIRLRQKRPLAERPPDRDGNPPWSPLGNVWVGGIQIPITAVLGGLGTFAAFVVAMVLDPVILATGGGWMIAGTLLYVAYRRHQGAAASRDQAGGVADPARGRGGRVPKRPRRLRRRRALLRGDGGDGEGARGAAPARDPRPLPGQDPFSPAARRRAPGARERRPGEDRAGEADLRAAGQRTCAPRPRRAGRAGNRRRGDRDRRGGDRAATALSQRCAPVRKDACRRCSRSGPAG